MPPVRSPISVPHFPRLSEYVGVWAMERSAFLQAAEIIRRMDLPKHVAETAPPALRSGIEKQTVKGKQIAVIKMTGSLMKQQSSLDGGSTSTVQLRRDIRNAAADPDIAGILLAVDSPGGTVAGTDDLATDIRNAGKEKPVWCHVDDLCASAAYWCASQCDKIYANSVTALVGSIGTLMTVYDMSGMAEKEGIKALVFATGSLKGAGTPGSEITDEQIEYYQGIVSGTQLSFDSAVRKGRSLTDKQLEAVRSGAIYTADDALERKLIDGIQSIDATLSALATATRSRAQASARLGSTTINAEKSPMKLNAQFARWLSAQGIDLEAYEGLPKAARKALKQSFRLRMSPDVPFAEAVETGEALNSSRGKPVSLPAGLHVTQPAAGDAVFNDAAAALSQVEAIKAIAKKHGDPQVEVGEGDAKHFVPFAAWAMQQPWRNDSRRVELEAIQQARPRGPAVFAHSHEGTCTKEALSAALILGAQTREFRARIDHPALRTQMANYFKIPEWLRADINNPALNRTLEAAHQFSDMSLIDIAREAVRMDGRQVPRSRQGVLEAAFSGGTLTTIFTTNINTIILQTYQDTADTTEPWCTVNDVADFKTNTRARMTKGPDLVKLPRQKEADHAYRSDTGENYKIARYARQWDIDEQDFIDDRFDALRDTPIEFGQAARRVRPNLVYAIILANPTLQTTGVAMFSASNGAEGNLFSGEALSAASLKNAVAVMGRFQENNINLNIPPTHLLVPWELRFLAKELCKSPNLIIAGTAGTITERGTTNMIQDEGITPIIESRLDNGVTDPNSNTTYSGSTSNWWLVSNRARTIEVGYLRGTGRAPMVREGVHEKGKWGMWWDIKMDIGAKGLDWRGFVQNGT